MKYFEKYNVEMNEETMILKITKDSPRSRAGFKIVVHVRFRTVERMHEYFVKEWVARMEKSEKEKAAQKAIVKNARENFVNPFQVGQVLYDSWGYDQTNIDFFQIVEVGKMSVKIRPISQIMTREAGFMCEYVKPAIDKFTGEESQKRVILDRNARPYVSGYRGSLSPWDREKIYQSHYA